MRHWPEFIRWNKNCPLIRGVCLLECPLIGENTVFQRQDDAKCDPTMNIMSFPFFITQVLVRNLEPEVDFEESFDGFFQLEL